MYPYAKDKKILRKTPNGQRDGRGFVGLEPLRPKGGVPIRLKTI